MRKFVIDTTERVVATAAEAALATLGTTALVQDVNWSIVGGTAALAAFAALLKALIARRRGDPDSASLVS